jgi:hypothetical protein
MGSSPLSFLRSAPPPPKVALLPSVLFFTRVISLAQGTPAVVASQVELAVEALSPFPLAQLYYGWIPAQNGSKAFIFAAYRRRFTTDQVASWEGAEAVLPAFAVTFGAEVEPGAVVMIWEAETLTAVVWGDSGIPERVVSKPIDPSEEDSRRLRIKEEFRGSLGGAKIAYELATLPEAQTGRSDRELIFQSGGFASRLAPDVTSMADVRDRGELAALRSARQRDRILWRTIVGMAAVVGLLAVGEFALIGGRAWQNVRVAKLNAQKPVVDKIMTAQDLANRIEDLATKQLLPLEMLTELVGVNLERKPSDIQFTRVQTDKSRGLYTVVIDAQTSNAPQMSVYQSALEKLPSKEKVEFLPQPSRGQFATFRIIFTFKPGSLKPSAS